MLGTASLLHRTPKGIILFCCLPPKTFRQLWASALPHRSLDYFLVVEAAGYELAYRDGIALLRGEISTVDLVLEPTTEGPYGYWWLLPDQDFSSLATAQARHPPELGLPGHILMTNLSGSELWQVPTGGECWGFDVAADGRAVAGCHDGNAYLTDAEGNLLWQVETGGLNREVRFSPDGAYIFTGPYQPQGERGPQFDAVLLDSATGEAVWTYTGPDEWTRNSRFSPDGQRIIAGFGGQLVMLTIEGTPLWNAYIGEFPLLLVIDSDSNVYAAGKNHELSSFDADGNLRWRHLIPADLGHAGLKNMPQDGGVIVFGTNNGWLHAYDNAGETVRKRKLLGVNGHNAFDMTPDGRWMVSGAYDQEEGALVGWLELFNQEGTLMWSHKSGDSRDPSELSYEFNHNQVGATAVAISDDGR